MIKFKSKAGLTIMNKKPVVRHEFKKPATKKKP